MTIQKVAHFFAELNHAKIQTIDDHWLSEKEIQLDVKRDDLLHPIISGNKWRKLKHVLLEIESQGLRKIAVMGGAYSNLLHSLSYLGRLLGWQVVLYVRGYPNQKLTPMLQDAVRWGAKIHYVDRRTFREIRSCPPQLDDDVFWIAEGGFNQLALKGSIESLMELNTCYDYLIIASATGTSLAGYCQGVDELSLATKVMGIAVLNNDNEIADHVAQLTQSKQAPIIIRGYEFGGYAKTTTELISFIEQFEQQQQIPLEPVYSGKSFFAVMDLIKNDYFPRGSKILLIHCGGLQAKRAC